jgi:hypothetical protein
MSIVENNQGGLTFIDVTVIVAYLLIMLYMGLKIARKQRSTEDFFVGWERPSCLGGWHQLIRIGHVNDLISWSAWRDV